MFQKLKSTLFVSLFQGTLIENIFVFPEAIGTCYSVSQD